MSKAEISADAASTLVTEITEFEEAQQRLARRRSPPAATKSNASKAGDMDKKSGANEPSEDSKGNESTERIRKPSKKPGTTTIPKWNKPAASLNTMVPREMKELIHDLIHRLQKEHRLNAINSPAPSIQLLTREAFEDLLVKHGALRRSRSSP